jgi:tetratricopeptide (TPR) repeat protein
MALTRLILALLFVVSLSLGSFLEPWYQNWNGGRNDSAHVLNMLIGDSRTLLANHFFTKADAYFHSGYYPTIFDPQDREEESHMTEEHAEESEAEHVHDENCKHNEEHHVHDENCDHEEEVEGGFLGAPKDWIDRFNRNFFPSQHSHLQKGGERELLPWMRLAADLDPHNIDTYTITSYWLRSRLGKIDEAEQFLREGLRANPTSYEIYFELGRIYDENRQDQKMARTLWEIALRKWDELSKNSPQENNLVYDGIVGRLAKLEESEGNLPKAIHYVKLLEENIQHLLAQEELEPSYRTALEQRQKHIRAQLQELETKNSLQPR